MTIYDPLEPLYQNLRRLQTMLGQEKYYLAGLQKLGGHLDNNIKAKIGALFGHIEELRTYNLNALQKNITYAEREIRQEIGSILNELLQMLREFRTRYWGH